MSRSYSTTVTVYVDKQVSESPAPWFRLTLNDGLRPPAA
jgi:hypothetical protein